MRLFRGTEVVDRFPMQRLRGCRDALNAVNGKCTGYDTVVTQMNIRRFKKQASSFIVLKVSPEDLLEEYRLNE